MELRAMIMAPVAIINFILDMELSLIFRLTTKLDNCFEVFIQNRFKSFHDFSDRGVVWP